MFDKGEMDKSTSTVNLHEAESTFLMLLCKSYKATKLH